MVVRGGGWRLDFNKNSATTTTTSQQQLKNSLRILKTNIQYRTKQLYSQVSILKFCNSVSQFHITSIKPQAVAHARSSTMCVRESSVKYCAASLSYNFVYDACKSTVLLRYDSTAERHTGTVRGIVFPPNCCTPSHTQTSSARLS